ncbi:hypothetical protein RR48_08836 [Papilio machaon]|uniref:Uncharacterized protein n=1 Tax=Papilio machaon TaxID=76193 RepID=A0A194QWP8_PAPMA|nr:hypothetical protein RR48_08836 [Papilio machaon]
MDDIIGLMKSTDPDILPVYVAKQLEKLPPITFDHLDCTALLKDLVRLKSDIESIKETYATNKQVDELKLEINNLKYASILPTPLCNVNSKRGAWNMDSGPIGLSHVDDLVLSSNSKELSPTTSTNNNNVSRSEYTNVISDVVTKTYGSNSLEQSDIQRIKSVKSNTKLNEPVSHTDNVYKQSAAVVLNQPGDNNSMQRPADQSSKYPHNENNTNDNEWTTVKRARNKYRFAGKTGVAKDAEGMFKAAVRMIPMFISNIHNDTKDDEIINYIRQKTNVSVILEKINIKKHDSYKAYKFFVPQSKLEMFLDETIWPTGVIFRRFVNMRHRSNNASSKTA